MYSSCTHTPTAPQFDMSHVKIIVRRASRWRSFIDLMFSRRRCVGYFVLWVPIFFHCIKLPCFSFNAQIRKRKKRRKTFTTPTIDLTLCAKVSLRVLWAASLQCAYTQFLFLSSPSSFASSNWITLHQQLVDTVVLHSYFLLLSFWIEHIRKICSLQIEHFRCKKKTIQKTTA